MNKLSQPIVILILGLTLLFSISAIDIYVPVISDMAISFSSSKQSLQLTISSFLAGLAISQLCIAVLSDLFGRRKILLLSLLFYFVMSLLCAIVFSVKSFMLLRFFQGVACGSVIVCVFSMSRDLFEGKRLIKVMGYITAIISLAPVISPFLGSDITVLFGWRGIFVFLVLTSALLIAIIRFFLPESLLKKNSDNSYYKSMLLLVVNRHYLIFSFLVALVYASYFAYLYNVSLIFTNDFHLSTNLIPLFIAANALALFLGSISTAYLIKFFNYKQVAVAALILMFTSSMLLMIINVKIIDYKLALFLVSMFINIFSIAILIPVLNSQALSSVKAYFGAAAGLSGFMRYGLAFLMGVIVAKFSINSINSVAIIFMATSLLSIFLLATIRA